MSRFEPFGDIVWHPTQEVISSSNLAHFIQKQNLGSYDALLRKSVNDIDWFWTAILKDLRIEFSKPYSQILDLSRGMPFPQWCVGGQMNIIYNCLDRYAGTPTDNKIALRAESEDGQI